MKGFMGWIKSNLMIVVSTAVILLSLPAGWFFASRWNDGIRDKQEKRANEAFNKIKNAKVTYVIPSLLPGEEPISESRPPNPRVTEYFAAQREERQRQAESVVGEVERFNQDGHTLLAPDLLPVPADARAELRLKFDFLAKMAGDVQLGAKSIYNDLLSAIGAGGPPDPIKLAATIQDVQERETERMRAESTTGSLTPEQQDQLRKLLMERRVAEAQRRAKEISVYADMASLDPQGFGPQSAEIPPRDRSQWSPTTPPTLNDAFEWNFTYWVVSDLLRAIDRANTDAGGTRANVEHAAVKRIEKLAVERLPVVSPVAGAMGAAPREEIDEGASAGADPSVSVTGRMSTDAYDVINAKLTLVVDAQRLPDIFKALADTNLMTVIDLDITEVDVWGDLRQGYFYGSDAPVVRAEMEIETIWLRSWTTPMMPESVKAALGIPTGEEEQLEDE